MIENILYCCSNKEYFLIRQILDQTLTIFRLSNVRLQHKNSRTCPMTDRYLHHCYSHLDLLLHQHICDNEFIIGTKHPLLIISFKFFIFFFSISFENLQWWT